MLVCVSSNDTIAPIFQLDTRSPGKCSDSELVGDDSICQPSLVSARQSPSQSSTTPLSGIITDSSSMAKPTLVSSFTGPTNRLPTSDTAMGRHDDKHWEWGSTKSDSPTSRVAYLKHRYTAEKISKPASDLLLASWRKKSSSSYDSMFKKWISWCKKRDPDPVSGPVSEVANVLATFYEEGYQYR